MYSFMRKAIDLLWHKGPIHQPVDDADYSNFRDGIAENIDTIRDDVKNVAYIRTPAKTPVFDDLEKEYGLTENDNLSLSTRLDLLETARYRQKTTAPDDDLQALLDSAGFDLTVYNNSPEGPSIDPAIILDQNFIMQAGDQTNDYAGQNLAYAGKVGGYLLPNGPIFFQTPAYHGCGDVYAGNDVAVCGYFDYLLQRGLDYPIPTNPLDWCFVFFVGGDATFDPVTKEILTIQQGLVPSEQQHKLETIILQFKPMFTWAAMVVTYT